MLDTGQDQVKEARGAENRESEVEQSGSELGVGRGRQKATLTRRKLS